MTPKQLAKHWGISEVEAKNIADFINRSYELAVVPVSENSHTLWQGVVYAYDPKNKYVSRESNKKFSSREEAILQWTDQIRQHIIPEGQAKQMRSGMGVPVDVCIALKPVKGYECIRSVQKCSFKQKD